MRRIAPESDQNRTRISQNPSQDRGRSEQWSILIRFCISESPQNRMQNRRGILSSDRPYYACLSTSSKSLSRSTTSGKSAVILPRYSGSSCPPTGSTTASPRTCSSGASSYCISCPSPDFCPTRRAGSCGTLAIGRGGRRVRTRRWTRRRRCYHTCVTCQRRMKLSNANTRRSLRRSSWKRMRRARGRTSSRTTVVTSCVSTEVGSVVYVAPTYSSIIDPRCTMA
ncbi:hypothetical protein OBBRIDRAFT_248360 [Obba rivulosa]|uniref:Uncharacterized protein n=1 Tax=Obba rivulosa TaxID=1052685 RepID=A0A8E2DFS0_9APHY|nr:hypothetical protein OBBRIDRAFT_248360 [Obba rivulosa]